VRASHPIGHGGLLARANLVFCATSWVLSLHRFTTHIPPHWFSSPSSFDHFVYRCRPFDSTDQALLYHGRTGLLAALRVIIGARLHSRPAIDSFSITIAKLLRHRTEKFQGGLGLTTLSLAFCLDPYRNRLLLEEDSSRFEKKKIQARFGRPPAAPGLFAFTGALLIFAPTIWSGCRTGRGNLNPANHAAQAPQLVFSTTARTKNASSC